MSADNFDVRDERGHAPQPDPLETIDRLVEEGEIIKAITFQYRTFTDGDPSRPVIHTNCWIAPTTPATSIEELNLLLNDLPEPDYPEKPEERRAKFVPNWGKTKLSDISYYRQAGIIGYSRMTAASNIATRGDIQRIAEEIGHPATIIVHQTIRVTIYPTAEIAQAVAAQQNSVLTEINSKSEVDIYQISDFDPSRPAAGLTEYSEDIHNMDFSLPRKVWNPTEAS
jgi:hypothetical protein